MHALVDAFIRWATGRRVAISWVAFFGFALLLFPSFDAINGMPTDVKALDIQFFYAPSRVFETLEILGGPGRTAYLRSLLIADVAWPLIYGTTLALSIAWGFDGATFQRRLVWLPVAAVLTDFAENLLISIHIVVFPRDLAALATVASAVSALKWLLAAAATMAALTALVRRRVQSRSESDVN